MAFQAFGMAAIGLPFGGFHFQLSDIEEVISQKAGGSFVEIPLNSEGARELLLDSKAGARLFTESVCRSFRQAVMVGRLTAAYAQKGAGALKPVPVEAWRTDDDFLRFDGWSYDPEAMGRADEGAPCWVFISRTSLDSVLAELNKWRTELLPWDSGQAPDPRMNYCNKWPLRFEALDDSLWALAPLLPDFAKAEEVSEGGVPRKRGGGPKPREYAQNLVRFFEKQHQFIADLSQRKRHKYVCENFSGENPLSARTTESHWQAHLNRRAEHS